MKKLILLILLLLLPIGLILGIWLFRNFRAVILTNTYLYQENLKGYSRQKLKKYLRELNQQLFHRKLTLIWEAREIELNLKEDLDVNLNIKKSIRNLIKEKAKTPRECLEIVYPRVNLENFLEYHILTRELEKYIQKIEEAFWVPSQKEVFLKVSAQTPLEKIERLFSGLICPIKGAKISYLDYHLPGSPRVYRSGIHQGLDFFSASSGVEIQAGTPVHAVQAGEVIRADHNYRSLSSEEIEKLHRYLQKYQSHSQKPLSYEEGLDKLRGRQVWLKHPRGIISKYCHLQSIPDNLQVGEKVFQGEVIGYVGSSGTLDGALNKPYAAHLHFELWYDDYFVGKDLPSQETRQLLSKILQTEIMKK
jgi:murein DD-endopeptidase MepM/ murein hydrolase activator NlpD